MCACVCISVLSHSHTHTLSLLLSFCLHLRALRCLSMAALSLRRRGDGPCRAFSAYRPVRTCVPDSAVTWAGRCRIGGAGVRLACYRRVHFRHRHAACEWLRIGRAVQLWWRIRPHDCCLAIFCFWIRAGVDHSAARIGMGVAWSGRNRWEPVRYR